jgi:cellulose synthase/poly-beta-1,6-N-acetylglucosamine synthase-like glycosyltransferase
MHSIIFWTSFICIIYVYLGYPCILYLWHRLQKPGTLRALENFKPSISIIISAFNEESSIGNRLQNLLSLDYPREKLEILVASDGSIDRTATIARSFTGVKVLDFRENRGRARVQNDGVETATGEIIIFTDADTEFREDCLKNLVRPFADDDIGCTVGNMEYRITTEAMAKAEGFYWQCEKRLRKLEGQLGLLATATGACMAVRKKLWKALTPTDDCDFTTPLDVILQGYRVVYVEEALAFETPPKSIRAEFRTRVRQTSKNLVGTLRRWGFKGWLAHPLVSWGLLSHKILRWLTAFFMVALLASNLALSGEGIIYRIFIFGQFIFYGVAGLGLLAELGHKRLAVASTIFAFCVACLGMSFGVVKGLAGRAPSSYRKAS